MLSTAEVSAPRRKVSQTAYILGYIPVHIVRQTRFCRRVRHLTQRCPDEADDILSEVQESEVLEPLLIGRKLFGGPGATIYGHRK